MKRILIVDDNLLVRKLIRNLFIKDNFQIEEAADGLEALEISRRKQFDLVITDILMPKMEGIELIMNLRRDFPEIRIIAISEGKPYYLYMAKTMGIDRVFTKPLNLEEFLKAVKKIIQFPVSDLKEKLSA